MTDTRRCAFAGCANSGTQRRKATLYVKGMTTRRVTVFLCEGHAHMPVLGFVVQGHADFLPAVDDA